MNYTGDRIVCFLFLETLISQCYSILWVAWTNRFSVNKLQRKGSNISMSAPESSSLTTQDTESQQRSEAISSTIQQTKHGHNFAQVAGLDHAKQTLRESLLLPVQFPGLFQGCRAPWRSLLLYGPPGLFIIVMFVVLFGSIVKLHIWSNISRGGVHVELCGTLRWKSQIPQKKSSTNSTKFHIDFSSQIIHLILLVFHVFYRFFTSISRRSPTEQHKKQYAAKWT